MAWTKFEKDKYRFSAQRYSFRGANASTPSKYVPQLPGLYAFPSNGDTECSSSSSESPDKHAPKANFSPTLQM